MGHDDRGTFPPCQSARPLREPMEISPDLLALSDALAKLDGPADEAGAWSTELWSTLRDAGATRWSVELADHPEGRPLLLERYIAIARGSLTAALILTQHDGAVKRLLAARGEPGRSADRWLAAIAEGRALATVGISHLTTSQRRGRRAVIAAPNGHPGGYRLDGAMPWVTSAGHADVVLAGATLDSDDSQQFLIALPTDRAGVSVDPAFPLSALQATETAEVRCEGVTIAPEDVIAGPATSVLGAATGGWETSALALGQARAAIDGLLALPSEAAIPAPPFDDEWRRLFERLLQLAREASPPPTAAAELRQRSNDLALRATQAHLMASKGSGLIRPHPAQRWTRQALVFLVWSCPAPVVQATLRRWSEFSGPEGCGTWGD